MRLGNLVLQNNLILAPMAGITDRPFRSLCRRLGAGLAVAEMVSADTTLWGTPKSLHRLDHQGEQGPIAAQIVGADPVAMAAAARLNVEGGADIVDINMGCPAKKVCRVAAGSALLKDERLVGRILAAVVAAVPVPVTLKIRDGLVAGGAQRSADRTDRPGERHCGPDGPRPHPRLRILRTGRIRHHPRHQAGGAHHPGRQW